jgi:flagellar biosynthesis component FlhA
MASRRRNSNPSIVPAVVFFLLGMFSKTPLFFIFAMFFFVRYIMTNQANSKRNNNQRRQQQQRRPQQRPTNQRQDYQQRQRKPEPIPRRQYRAKSNPFKKTGIQKYKDFDMDGAIADFEQGLAIDSKDVALHFNIAAAYSLTEQKEKAFHHLSEAVKLGFKDFERINTHDDLAFLRIQPEFDEFKENGYKFDQQKRTIPVKEEEVTDDVLLSQLNKLAEMRKKGLLSNDEFILEKEKLLRQ